jgi:hypothetical protein
MRIAWNNEGYGVAATDMYRWTGPRDTSPLLVLPFSGKNGDMNRTDAGLVLDASRVNEWKQDLSALAAK